jgi:hypothetical protein
MILVKINNIDVNDKIKWETLSINQKLTSQVDSASFTMTEEPEINKEIVIYNDSEKVFGGYIIKVSEDLLTLDKVNYKVECKDYTHKLDGILIQKTYEDSNAQTIIADLINDNAPEFNTDNVISIYPITRIVFNQVSLTECIRRLASIMDYEWYIDSEKNIHYFQRFSRIAPFNITDTSGKHIYKSVKRNIDATQIANRIRVRGGMADEENITTDYITVQGNDTKSFVLPYKYSGLQIWVDSGAGYVEQTVGIDNIDDFTTKDVLYNYQADSIRFENALADGDIIKFSGYKKYLVMAQVDDAESIALFGLREKLIRDSTIEDSITARQRARAELNTYKDKISDLNFKTYDSGLVCGQVIRYSSESREVSELDFIIDTISFKTRTPFEFEYSVKATTTRKYGLIEFLRKLAEGSTPDHFKEEETEVLEKLELISGKIQIAESIQAVLPRIIEGELTITEAIEILDIEPEWVLAYYVPTGPTDVKRMGHLDISMELY